MSSRGERQSIALHKIAHQTEDWLVAVETNGFVRIVDGVVVLESIALLVLQKDTGHMASGEGIMVAIGCQIASMERSEMLLLVVYLLEQVEATHSFVAYLAIYYWVIVANHVNIK